MAIVTADVVTWQDTAGKQEALIRIGSGLFMYVPERRLFMEPHLRRYQQKRSWGRPVQWLRLSADHVTGYPGRRFPEQVAIISTGNSRGKAGFGLEPLTTKYCLGRTRRLRESPPTLML